MFAVPFIALPVILLYLITFVAFIFFLIWSPDLEPKKKGKSSALTGEEKKQLEAEDEVKSEAEREQIEELSEEKKESSKGTSVHLGRLAPSGYANYLRDQMIYSGSPSGVTLETMLTAKVLAAVAAALIISPLLIAPSARAYKFIIMMAAALVAFFIPDVLLSNKADKRQKKLDLALPDSLDLLTISVEAGLSFDSSISKVVDNSSGPLAEEFFRLLQEMQLGISRRQAFRNLIKRTRADELRYFVTTIIQSDAYGISIAKVLRSQSKEIKIKRRQKAEETAIKAPVKIVFPLILCIFPALLVIILGPAGIRIAGNLSQLGR